MPRKNVNKIFSSDSYYHVYNHGVFGQEIFASDKDYAAFLNLLKRYLSKEQAYDITRRPVPHLISKVELLAYCLMPNHFHMLIYNKQDDGLSSLMRSLMTAYGMYFNKIHKRRGVLFESSYKASLIQNEEYLWHISRYIHLNPQDLSQDFALYPYSSYRYYLGQKTAEWLNPGRIQAMHSDVSDDYVSFVKDYEGMRAELQTIKYSLADN